jgi:hypothetical protein
MSNGSKTYNSFTDARASLERQARTHAENIHDAERRMQGIVQRQGKLWSQLAAIHINSNLELPPSVQRSMDGRHSKIEAKKIEVERIKTALSSLKRKRDAAAEERASHAEKLNADHRAIFARFEADPKVIDLHRRIFGLTQSFTEANEKKNRAEAELAQKRVAYETDELFGYLRRRGYGTPTYSAWFPLTRALDAALARATSFKDERANYDLLVAVPGWTDERIAALVPTREKANVELSHIEREYFGSLDQQKNALDAMDEALREVDRAIAAENDDIAVANKFLSDAALAEDSELKRVISDFSSILAKRGFSDLKRLASETKDTEDDNIVRELQTLVGELATLSRKVEAEKNELFVCERKVKSFEQVERHLRSKGWNDSRHSFNGVNTEYLTSQLSSDTFTAAVVIGMLSNAHEEPRRSDYGSSYGSSGSSYSSRSEDTPTFSTTDSFGGGNSDNFTTTDSF